MNAYACTECGRCTSECPANITGKKLSPRKIMMDVRDRVEELGNGDAKDGKSLLGDYISKEEIFACTSCNACVEACPVNIDPLNIILQLASDIQPWRNPPARLTGIICFRILRRILHLGNFLQLIALIGAKNHESGRGKSRKAQPGTHHG